MPTPPPLPDPTHIETRLLVVAEMLEKAVAEVHRAMADLKAGPGAPAGATDEYDPPDDTSRSLDA